MPREEEDEDIYQRCDGEPRCKFFWVLGSILRFWIILDFFDVLKEAGLGEYMEQLAEDKKVYENDSLKVENAPKIGNG